MFGVSQSTLSEILNSKKEYKGKGKRSKVLTEEEESFIAQR